MFGYVKTDFPNMYMKDNLLYKSMYCGLCKGIAKTVGQKARFLLSYDLTFLSVFVHNVCGQDVKINKERCILHQIVKRPIATPDDITNRIGALNVIMAYHKLNDDVLDNGKGKFKRSLFTRAFKKAKKKEARLEEIVRLNYNKLLEYEKNNCESIDIICDPFSQMVADIVKELCQNSFDEHIYQLSYYLGKWIYLIDALDDFDKDKKTNCYNVFLNAYNDCASKDELLNKHKLEIVQFFGDILLNIEENNKLIKYNFNHDLIDNILLRGLREQTKNVVENKKCKRTTKS